jgi:hypothetical protein
LRDNELLPGQLRYKPPQGPTSNNPGPSGPGPSGSSGNPSVNNSIDPTSKKDFDFNFDFCTYSDNSFAELLDYK